MIMINNLTKSVPKPFRWWEKEREFCSYIIEDREIKAKGCRLGAIHSAGWIIIKIAKLRAQKDNGEELKIDLVAGSNEEKMSTIM